MARRNNPDRFTPDPPGLRTPGDIPADFHYRREGSQPIDVSPRRGPKPVTTPTWGLWPLGYRPASVSAWLTAADLWQPTDTPAGHPYLAICQPDQYPPTDWPIRFSVIVPTRTMDRHLGYHDEDLHRRTQPSTPIHAHPNWVNLSTGQAVDRSERNHLTVPGVAVFTTELTNDQDLRATLATHDAILRTSPETYLLQAALQRRTD